MARRVAKNKQQSLFNEATFVLCYNQINMEKAKSNNQIITTGVFIFGILLGWIIWGSGGTKTDHHVMPDGSIMSNNQMTSMQHSMDSMTESLKGKTGTEFDKEFLEQMIIHHEGAVEMSKMVLTSSQNPELIKLANDIISAQNKEIEMMKEWKNNWFK